MTREEGDKAERNPEVTCWQVWPEGALDSLAAVVAGPGSQAGKLHLGKGRTGVEAECHTAWNTYSWD